MVQWLTTAMAVPNTQPVHHICRSGDRMNKAITLLATTSSRAVTKGITRQTRAGQRPLEAKEPPT